LRQPLRRLSHHEYWNTVRDLFPGVEVTRSDLAADDKIDGFTNNVGGQRASSLLVEQYHNVATALARDLTADQLAGLVPCAGGLECARTWIADFGQRAFRRPLEEGEAADFLATFETGPGAEDFDLGVRLTVIAMLQSPQFLYRPELGDRPDATQDSVSLTPYEVASRLSYLIWATMPDQELLAAADSGALNDSDERNRQMERLLGDDKTRDGVGHFLLEWLKLDKVTTALKRAEDAWDDGLKAELSESGFRFAYDVVFSRGGTAADLMTSTEFPATARLAELFGVEAPDSVWGTISPAPEQRAGILTHPAFLGAHGYGAYPSPVLRGVFVLDRVLCAPPSPPPGGVSIILPDEEPQEPRTNREAYVNATAGDVCIGCHTTINGFGFAFENYDTLGRYRVEDAGFPVDATGSVGEFEFANATQLAAQLAESNAYRACVVRKWLNYSLGGSELAADRTLRAEVLASFGESNFELRSLVTSLGDNPRYSGLLSVEVNE
jgi:hypothetical protein